MSITRNTHRRFVRASPTERFKDGVDYAWELYGPFGRSHGVWSAESLGTFAPDSMMKEWYTKHKGKRVWQRIIWVRYEKEATNG